MKFQIVTPYCVSHLQRYGVTVRGNVTGVYRPLVDCLLAYSIPTRPADSHLTSTTCTSCYIYTLLPPDDGLLASPKHVKV
jgi:hypothetical protein